MNSRIEIMEDLPLKVMESIRSIENDLNKRELRREAILLQEKHPEIYVIFFTKTFTGDFGIRIWNISGPFGLLR